MKLINFEVGIDQPLFLIAGPCVIESEDMTLRVADELKNVCMKLDVPFIFNHRLIKQTGAQIVHFVVSVWRRD